MAVAVEEKKDPAAKFRSAVDEQIAQATGRIRAHDLTFGGLTLAAFVAVYATAMIVTDKYLNLAEWVRQLVLRRLPPRRWRPSSYWLIVRPLRKRINPLYAAARVEKTIDDAKNSITGYVEAQEKGEVHVAVKTAMGAKAAKAVGEADVNRAVDHRSLIVAGGILVALPARARGPLLRLPPEPVQLARQPGVLPVLLRPDRQADRRSNCSNRSRPTRPSPPARPSPSPSTSAGRCPRRTVPNRSHSAPPQPRPTRTSKKSRWRRAKRAATGRSRCPITSCRTASGTRSPAGDNETPEYRVTVRTLPMFTEFEATYEYPAYTPQAHRQGHRPRPPGLPRHEGHARRQDATAR